MNTKIIFIAFLIFGLNDALHIHINPEKYTDLLADSVQISCLPDGSDSNIKEVVMMDIYRNGENPLVVINQNSKITLRQDATKHLKAEGHLDKDVNKCYLNLTILKPTRQDTGIYSCMMLYLDQSGLFGQTRVKGDLDVEKTDISTLELVLRNVLQKVSHLENDIRGDGFVRGRIGTLEEKVRVMDNKDNIKSAFSVTNDAKLYLTIGKPLIFPKLIMKEGNGYNKTTGVFTAPVDGLYAFHLVASIANSGCRININLFVNDTVVGRLEAGSRSYEDQSSISTVTDLVAGETVKLIVKHSISCFQIYGLRYSLYSGYLVKAY